MPTEIIIADDLYPASSAANAYLDEGWTVKSTTMGSNSTGVYVVFVLQKPPGNTLP